MVHLHIFLQNLKWYFRYTFQFMCADSGCTVDNDALLLNVFHSVMVKAFTDIKIHISDSL